MEIWARVKLAAAWRERDIVEIQIRSAEKVRASFSDPVTCNGSEVTCDKRVRLDRSNIPYQNTFREIYYIRRPQRWEELKID